MRSRRDSCALAAATASGTSAPMCKTIVEARGTAREVREDARIATDTHSIRVSAAMSALPLLTEARRRREVSAQNSRASTRVFVGRRRPDLEQTCSLSSRKRSTAAAVSSHASHSTVCPAGMTGDLEQIAERLLVRAEEIVVREVRRLAEHEQRRDPHLLERRRLAASSRRRRRRRCSGSSGSASGRRRPRAGGRAAPPRRAPAARS